MGTEHVGPLRTSDFDYALPEELIARFPPADRGASRLLCLDRTTGQVTHRQFNDLPELLRPGDVLVMNDTKVIPARVYGVKSTGTRIELLFTRRIDALAWAAIVHPGRRLKKGATLFLESDPSARLSVREVLDDGSRIIALDQGGASLDELIERYGAMPLPHYLNRDPVADDRVRYQTVYARENGAVAAPTAGLHFTEETLTRIRERGVETVWLTLHVGIGTFRPVSVENPLDHPMHAEPFSLGAAAAETIRRSRESGGRVVAVGTTVVRTLEHIVRNGGALSAQTGETRMFILPGYRFLAVDALITNFHLPQSTLIMLVAAFAGTKTVLAAYAEAVRERYRFFSYGDAMFIS